MALNVKDPATDRLGRELAQLTGETITDTVRHAIEERLARVQARNLVASQGDQLHELIARGRARATVDTRTVEEIIGYDESGLPR